MKKIMTIIAAAAVALTLVGCANFGDAKASGTKYKKSFSLDATGDIGADALFARGFVALSASKGCSAIETTITLPKDDNIVATNDGYSVVGLAFDVHVTKDANNKEFYDFVLVGVQPKTGYYYVEKYENIAKDDLKESMNTKDKAIGGATATAAAGAAKWTSLDGKGTKSFVEKDVKAAKEDGSYEWTVKVTQDTAGAYVVAINDIAAAGAYTRTLTEAEAASKDKKLVGQVFMYGNAPKGTKIKANFNSNKDKTTGLFADEEEF